MPNRDILKPQSTDEVVSIVRKTIADRTTLRLTQPGAHESPHDGELLVSLQDMASVVDYPARDMTITVQAGMRANELGRILAEESQQLPIDCFNRSASVGSMVAADSAGPRQYGYGTLRDYLIGIEAVDGHGRVFHAGGRVVKNVAGYDLCRLMVGSRGSLAVLTQLTFKLKPLPQQSLLTSFRFPDYDALAAALNRMNVSAATPVVLDLAAGPNAATDHGDLPGLSFGVEGSDAACDWQAQQIRNDCGSSATLVFDSRDPSHRPPGSPEFRIPEHCRGFGYGWTEGQFRIAAPPSTVASIAEAITAADYHVVGHAGNGILYAIAPMEQVPAEASDVFTNPHRDGFHYVAKDDPKLLQICEELATRHGGHVSTWESSHPARKSDPLSVRLRESFDPHGVFGLAEVGTTSCR